MSHCIVRAPFYSGVHDFTFYLPTGEAAERFEEGSPIKTSAEPPTYQVDNTATLELCADRNSNGPRAASTESPKNIVTTQGRLNVCSSFAGRQVSCTFRIEEGKKTVGGHAKYHRAYKIEKSGFAPDRRSSWSDYDLTSPLKKPKKGNERYMNSMDEICEDIYDRILRQPTDPHGLIVIAGATNAGKSKVARGLIYKHLATLVPEKGSKTRRPHLVTFEDPIERYWNETPKGAAETGIDYTPREKGEDVGSLAEAVNAALRQTPKLFFAGETRDPQDWKDLFRIAATGHLCLTTTHAGSLTETMGHLLHAMNAKSPAERSDLARRVLAVVHLRKIRLPQNNGEGSIVSLTLPAVWVASPVSAMTLMADGLTSLLPFRDAPPGRDMGCFGRTYFAERLMGSLSLPDAVREAIEDRVLNAARALDLEGI
jgi:hypothetical protein